MEHAQVLKEIKMSLYHIENVDCEFLAEPNNHETVLQVARLLREIYKTEYNKLNGGM